VRAFSVKDGVVTEVAGFYAYDPAFPGGVSVAAGDVNGDGVEEIITGAGPGGGPHVRAFSVADGVVSEVAGFYAYDPTFPGGVSVAVGDVNGDGVAEIITGAGPGGGPHVKAFSLAGGVVTEVAGFYAYDPAFPGGVRVADADLTGNHHFSLRRTIHRPLGSHLIDAELPDFLSRLTLAILTPPEPHAVEATILTLFRSRVGQARAPPYAGTAGPERRTG
jgi:hypothetical protein